MERVNQTRVYINKARREYVKLRMRDLRSRTAEVHPGSCAGRQLKHVAPGDSCTSNRSRQIPCRSASKPQVLTHMKKHSARRALVLANEENIILDRSPDRI